MSAAPNIDAATDASPISERFIQELVSDYYLHQVAQTHIDYIDLHKEGLVALPFEYADGERIELEISPGVGAGVLRLCDLGAVNEYLVHCYQLYPRGRVDTLRRNIENLCKPEGVVLDGCEGLYLYTRTGRYVDALHRFIATLLRVDALFRAFYLMRREASGERIVE